jgi:triacylglycerol lipase
MTTSSPDTYSEAQVAMTLAAISYAPQSEIAGYLSNPAYATAGEWTLTWGPSDTPGNQMFVAKHRDANRLAISIRGTVPRFSLAMLVDLYQDLDVGHPKPWPYPVTPGAMVAGGALDGLNDLLTMTSGGQSVLDYIKAQTSAPDCEILVTGHSLGGGLATVLAPWLQYELSQSGLTATINVYTYAAPTAGNQAFADFYNNLFSQSARYYNDIDVIPMAWANLAKVKALYPAPGPQCLWEIRDTVDLVNLWLSRIDGVVYVDPNGSGSPLNGTAVASEDFLAEIGTQHGHNNYLQLLGAPLLPF